MLKNRLMTALAGIVIAVLGPLSVAAPAQASTTPAATAFSCTVYVDTPWHSLPPLNNRVYFNSHVLCSTSGYEADVIDMFNGGYKNGQLGDYENKHCTRTYSCYSTGGQTYINYTGAAQYCGVIQANISLTSLVTKYLSKKVCVNL